MPLFETRSLHCGYGKNEVCHAIDFRIALGEIVAILGPNGCGKSTFVKAALGYLKASAGSILFENREIQRRSPTQRVSLGIGYIPQLLNIFRPLSVEENLEMGGYGPDRQTLASSMQRFFELFPILGERRSQQSGSLSGGERQLLATARAMMPNPKLLFLDEPSAGLSPRMAVEVTDHIEAVGATGTAMVVVEQDVHRALSISQRGYVFVTGQVEFEGSADSILADERIRGAFLGG